MKSHAAALARLTGKPTAERDVKATALKLLSRVSDIEVIRQQSGSRGNGRMKLAKKGHADLQILLPAARTMFVELKRNERAKLRPSQIAMHARLRWLGHEVVVTHDPHYLLDLVLLRVREAWLSIGPYDRPIGETKAEASNGGRG